MNTELLKSKLLEAAFNGSLTHADTSKWKRVMLEDVGTIITGSTPSKAHAEYYGKDYPFYKPSDLEAGINVTSAEDNLSKIGYEHARHLPANSVLVTCIASVGKTGLIRREGSCNQQINAIVPNDKCNCFYLYYLMISPSMQEKIKFMSRSTTVAILNKTRFSTIEIPLPSVEEQKHIVSTLEEGFAAIDAIAAAKENLSSTAEMLRSKILQAAFDGSLTGVDAGIWDQKKLRDISTKIVDGDHNPPKGQKEPTPYIMLSSQNINEDKFVAMNKVRYLSKADFDLCNKRTKLTKGDVLLTTVGTVGRSCVNTGDEVYCFQRSVTIITPAINSFFLKYYFDSPDFQQLLLLSASGNAQKGFYLNKLKEVEIPVPPLAEQQRIVAKIEELFAEIDKLTK